MNIKEVNPEHNLYIIRVYGKEGSLIKLGYSSNIIQRLYSYYNHNPLIQVIGTYYREDAEQFESKLHKVIKAKMLHEWYDESELTNIEGYIKGDILPEKETDILPYGFKGLKDYRRYLLGEDFRYSEDKDIKRIRQQILTSFKLKQWYSSADIKTKIQSILAENNGNVSLNRAGEVFQFLFETTENIKKIDGKNVRGYTIIRIK
jgi:hypothetical protein